MSGLTKSKLRVLRAGLIGGILAAASVLGFVGLLMTLQWIGRVTTGAAAAVQTASLTKPLAMVAIPLGVLIGLLAGRLQRGRKGILLTLGVVAYLLTSMATTVWFDPAHARATTLVAQLGRGLWAALTFAIVAAPPLVLAYWLFERMTRTRRAPDEKEPTEQAFPAP